MIGKLQLNINSPNYLYNNKKLGDQFYGNPDYSFFKKVYVKQTNFSVSRIYSEIKDINKIDKFNKNFSIKIPQQGDLLKKVYLEIDVNCSLKNSNVTSTYTVNHFINSFIEKTSFEIAHCQVEEYLSQWKQIRTEFKTKTKTPQVLSCETAGGNEIDLNFTSDLKRTEYDANNMDECGIPIIVGGNYNNKDIDLTGGITKKIIYEFDFWFCRNLGQALPISVIKNQDLEIKIKTAEKKKVIGDNTHLDLKITNIRFLSDQIFLDTDEKQIFNKDHEYIIDVVKYNSTTSLRTSENTKDSSTTTLESKIYELDFNFPIKCLLWVVLNPGLDNNNKGQGPCYFTSLTNSSLYGSDGTEGSVELQFNAYSRSKFPMIYFTRKNPKLYCGNIPPLDRIGLCSFALKPFDQELTGFCNMGNIKDKRIIFEFANNNVELIKNKRLLIFALGYNILKIQSNTAQLLWCN
mgnify:CR=1 FL=1